MNVLISMFIGSYSRIYSTIAGVAIIVYSYIINRNSKLRSENKSLNEGIEEIKGGANKIITIQKMQADIAARPTSTRDELHGKLRDLSSRSKQNSK